MTRYKATVLALALAATGTAPAAWGNDLAIKVPRRAELTPVQKLNREGVEAVRKHRYARAEALFYKAYLFDPDDPFTLNNLGYVSELKGDVDRAAKYYALAAKGNSDAIIDQSSLASLKGKPLDQAFTRVEDVGMKVNQANVKAIRLLSEDRVREADDLLQQTVTLDPGNPFTLN